MTNTLTALVAAATLATEAAAVPTTADARCAMPSNRHVQATARLRVLSRLCGTAARVQLQLVPHADL